MDRTIKPRDQTPRMIARPRLPWQDCLRSGKQTSIHWLLSHIDLRSHCHHTRPRATGTMHAGKFRHSWQKGFSDRRRTRDASLGNALIESRLDVTVTSLPDFDHALGKAMEQRFCSLFLSLILGAVSAVLPEKVNAQSTWEFRRDQFNWFGYASVARASDGALVSLRCSPSNAPIEVYPGDASLVSLFEPTPG